MADFESERRECLRRGWGFVGASGEWARANAHLVSGVQDSRVLRGALWGLMVGSHSKP